MVHHDRRRYLVVRIKGRERVGKGLLIKLTRDRTRSLSPEEFSRIKPWIVYYNRGWAIVKTGHLGAQAMKEMIEEINSGSGMDHGIEMEVVGVSGTIRRAFMKYVPEGVRAERHYHEEREKRD